MDERPDLVVIGVGNRDRGDDAIGPLVADALRARRGWRTMEADGDLSDLALRWPLDAHVVVVDATVTGASPGTVHVVDGVAGRPDRPVTTWSTHGIGLGDAIELARVLGRLPAGLTVIGVEADRFDDLAPLSPAVAAAMPIVIDAVDATVAT